MTMLEQGIGLIILVITFGAIGLLGERYEKNWLPVNEPEIVREKRRETKQLYNLALAGALVFGVIYTAIGLHEKNKETGLR